jgi:aminopeptidase N
MLFHMLRQRLGDETFIRALRDFYGSYLFRFADYGDLRQSFERVAGQDLKIFLAQWTERSGAPELAVDGTKVQKEGDGFVLTLNLEQKQKGSPYRLRVPLAVTLEGRAEAHETTVEMTVQAPGVPAAAASPAAAHRRRSAIRPLPPPAPAGDSARSQPGARRR